MIFQNSSGRFLTSLHNWNRQRVRLPDFHATMWYSTITCCCLLWRNFLQLWGRISTQVIYSEDFVIKKFACVKYVFWGFDDLSYDDFP